MNHENQLEQVELGIKEAEEMIELADSLQRLHNNKDFKIVITNGYFVEEARRAVLLKSDPEMQSNEHQKQVDNIILSVGGLYAYFNKTYQMGNMAQRSLEDNEQTRSEILQEQLGEDTIQ